MPAFYLWHCVFSPHEPHCTWTCASQSERQKMRKRREGKEGTKLLRFLQNPILEKADSVLVLDALSSDSQIFLG